MKDMYPYAEADTYVEAQYLSLPDIVGFLPGFSLTRQIAKKFLKSKTIVAIIQLLTS